MTCLKKTKKQILLPHKSICFFITDRFIFSFPLPTLFHYHLRIIICSTGVGKNLTHMSITESCLRMPGIEMILNDSHVSFTARFLCYIESCMSECKCHIRREDKTIFSSKPQKILSSSSSESRSSFLEFPKKPGRNFQIKSLRFFLSVLKLLNFPYWH